MRRCYWIILLLGKIQSDDGGRAIAGRMLTKDEVMNIWRSGTQSLHTHTQSKRIPSSLSALYRPHAINSPVTHKWCRSHLNNYNHKSTSCSRMVNISHVKVKASHTRYRSLWTKLIHVYRQSARSHYKNNPHSGRLRLLSGKPHVTFPAAEHYRALNGIKLYCLITEARTCEQLAHGYYADLPRVGFQQTKSNTVPVSPLRHVFHTYAPKSLNKQHKCMAPKSERLQGRCSVKVPAHCPTSTTLSARRQPSS